MPIAISPNFDDSVEQTLENKINIFEDQIQGWLFNPAKDLINNQHAGFAILSIVLTYFEPIAQFLEGRTSGSKR